MGAKNYRKIKHETVRKLREDEGQSWTRIAVTLGVSAPTAQKVYESGEDRKLNLRMRGGGRKKPNGQEINDALQRSHDRSEEMKRNIAKLAGAFPGEVTKIDVNFDTKEVEVHRIDRIKFDI